MNDYFQPLQRFGSFSSLKSDSSHDSSLSSSSTSLTNFLKGKTSPSSSPSSLNPTYCSSSHNNFGEHEGNSEENLATTSTIISSSLFSFKKTRKNPCLIVHSDASCDLQKLVV